ncbi:MAG: hypothetical protein Q7R81_03640 [Candidatus Peregrinibacteria bacterium]|nr:hypothetical protein [Candidatus Peregrinibacteria bacterium]
MNAPSPQGPEHGYGLNRRTFLKVGATAGITLATAFGLGKLLKHDEHNPIEVGVAKDHRKLVLEAWKKDQPMIDAIHEGGFQAFVNRLGVQKKELILPREVLENMPLCDCCLDEGIEDVDDDDGSQLQLVRHAGSGIILTNGVDPKVMKPTDPRYMNMVAQDHNERGSVVEADHDLCGARLVAYGIVHGITDPAELDKIPDEEIMKWGQEHFTFPLIDIRKKLLRAKGKHDQAAKIHYRRIKQEELHRPAEVHIARVVYDIQDPTIKPNGLIPKGYIVTGHTLSREETDANMKAAVKINLATSHGPQELFTKENPMMWVVAGCNPKVVGARVQHLLQLAKTLPEDRGRRVVVDGFVV